MNQSKTFSQGEEAYPEGGEMPSESRHEGEVAR